GKLTPKDQYRLSSLIFSAGWKSTGKALSIGVVSSYSLKLTLLKIDLIKNTTHVMAFMCTSSLLMVFKEKRTIY
uniref:Uncharacterized protein n=1 Tax=Aegilops tauschii subsp. strangulata TaxID=200361 RepID=A0A453EYM2_AEGTS